MENVFHKTMRILNRRLLKNSCLANFHFHKQWARKKRDQKEKKTFKNHHHHNHFNPEKK